jgi:hypothetical protein
MFVVFSGAKLSQLCQLSLLEIENMNEANWNSINIFLNCVYEDDVENIFEPIHTSISR